MMIKIKLLFEIRVDSKEVYRMDWAFKLVGSETFKLGKNNATCVIKIEPLGGFSYQYSLEVHHYWNFIFLESTPILQ